MLKTYIDDKYLLFTQEQGSGKKDYLTQFKQFEPITEICISSITYTIVKRVIDGGKLRLLAMNEGIFFEIVLNSVISDNGKNQSLGIRYSSKDKLNFAFIGITFEHMIPEMDDEQIERIKTELDKPSSLEQIEYRRIKGLYKLWFTTQIENGYDEDLLPNLETFISRPSLIANAEKLQGQAKEKAKLEPVNVDALQEKLNGKKAVKEVSNV